MAVCHPGNQSRVVLDATLLRAIDPPTPEKAESEGVRLRLPARSLHLSSDINE
jgi:hypothetical protein